MKEQSSRRALIMASPIPLRRAALAQILHNSRRLAGRSLSGTLSNRPASGGSRFFRGLYLSPERVPEPRPFWPSAAFAALSALRRAFSSMRTASALAASSASSSWTRSMSFWFIGGGWPTSFFLNDHTRRAPRSSTETPKIGPYCHVGQKGRLGRLPFTGAGYPDAVICGVSLGSYLRRFF